MTHEELATTVFQFLSTSTKGIEAKMFSLVMSFIKSLPLNKVPQKFGRKRYLKLVRRNPTPRFGKYTADLRDRNIGRAGRVFSIKRLNVQNAEVRSCVSFESGLETGHLPYGTYEFERGHIKKVVKVGKKPALVDLRNA